MKTWCEHWLWDEDKWKEGYHARWIEENSPVRFCEVCGTPRPVEKNVVCPSKIAIGHMLTKVDGRDVATVGETVNEIIDYLESKPWENK